MARASISRPGAALAVEEHRAAARCHARQQLDDLAHRRRAAEDAVGRDLDALRRLRGSASIDQVLRVGDDGSKVPRHDRRRQDVEHAGAERLERGLGTVGIDDADEQRLRLLGAHAARQAQRLAAPRAVEQAQRSSRAPVARRASAAGRSPSAATARAPRRPPRSPCGPPGCCRCRARRCRARLPGTTARARRGAVAALALTFSRFDGAVRGAGANCPSAPVHLEPRAGTVGGIDQAAIGLARHRRYRGAPSRARRPPRSPTCPRGRRHWCLPRPGRAGPSRSTRSGRRAVMPRRLFDAGERARRSCRTRRRGTRPGRRSTPSDRACRRCFRPVRRARPACRP